MPNSSLTIQGSKVEFDSKGMTKQQIVELAPYVTDIKINSEQTIGFVKADR
jgi:hypothetical protein